MDASDPSPLYGAVREFGEEMGLIPRTIHGRAKHVVVSALLSFLQRSGTLVRVLRNRHTGYTAYALVVDDALVFERAVGLLNAGQSVTAKADTQLSSETKGYTWVSKGTLEHPKRLRSTARNESYTVLEHPMLPPHPLRVRRGVLGTQLTAALRLA